MPVRRGSHTRRTMQRVAIELGRRASRLLHLSSGAMILLGAVIIVLIRVGGDGYAVFLFPLAWVIALPLNVLAAAVLCCAEQCNQSNTCCPCGPRSCFRHNYATPLRPIACIQCHGEESRATRGVGRGGASVGANTQGWAQEGVSLVLVQNVALDFARDFGWDRGTRAAVSGRKMSWGQCRCEELAFEPPVKVCRS